MAISNSTDNPAAKPHPDSPTDEQLGAIARGAQSPRPPLAELPINIINDRPDQAHATLDLLHTAMADSESAQLFIETLNWQTLSTAIYSVMLRIREAKEIAGNWHSRQAVTS